MIGNTMIKISVDGEGGSKDEIVDLLNDIAYRIEKGNTYGKSWDISGDYEEECGMCEGLGTIDDEDCRECKGSGVIIKTV